MTQHHITDPKLPKLEDNHVHMYPALLQREKPDKSDSDRPRAKMHVKHARRLQQGCSRTWRHIVNYHVTEELISDSGGC